MQFRRRLAPISVLNLVPMVDVVFNLVVFFMVSSTFIVTPAIKLSLPQASSAEPTAMGRLIVTVQGPDSIYLNRTRYNLAGLDQALATLKPQERTDSVILEGDQSISYDQVIQVLDVLRRNGFHGINLRMQPAAPPASQ